MLKKIKIIIPGLLIGCILLLAASYAGGIRLNLTKSLPRGIYYSKKISGDLYQHRGKYVSVCVNPRNPVIQKAKEWHVIHAGYCPGHLMPFLKKLVGLPGDTISIDHDGVSINGQRLKNSRLKSNFFELFIHPGYRRTLQPDEYWVMSNYSPNSLDSRYFGPVNRSAILTISKPLYLIDK